MVFFRQAFAPPRFLGEGGCKPCGVVVVVGQPLESLASTKMSSRGVLFDRRGNPTPLALVLVGAVCLYIYRGDASSSRATHTKQGQPRDPLPPPHGGGGDDAELQRALRHIPAEAAADARAVPGRPVRRDALPDPVVVAATPPPVVERTALAGGSPHRAERTPVPDYRPVRLTLQLPDKYLNEPALATRETMFRQYVCPCSTFWFVCCCCCCFLMGRSVGGC